MFVVKDPECQYQIEERSWHSAGITGFGARFLALLLWFQRSRVIWWGSRWEPSVSAQYLKGTISIYLDKKGGQMLAKQESKVWYTPSEREVTAQRTRQRSKMQSFHACFTLYHCRLIYFFFFFLNKDWNQDMLILKIYAFWKQLRRRQSLENQSRKETSRYVSCKLCSEATNFNLPLQVHWTFSNVTISGMQTPSNFTLISD